MEKCSRSKFDRAGRTVRLGRPPKELAAEVDERIFDAARELFLERGLADVSVEEIARHAHASKATIYGRFPTKEMLFAAIAMRNAAKVTEGYVGDALSGNTIEERLRGLGRGILERLLADDHVDFIRLAVAESHRFPDLARVGRLARERGEQNAAAVFEELVLSGQGTAYPALVRERLLKTAKFFLDFVVAPLLMRAVLGEEPRLLRMKIRGHVAESVSFFLAACKSGHADR